MSRVRSEWLLYLLLSILLAGLVHFPITDQVTALSPSRLDRLADDEFVVAVVYGVSDSHDSLGSPEVSVNPESTKLDHRALEDSLNMSGIDPRFLGDDSSTSVDNKGELIKCAVRKLFP